MSDGIPDPLHGSLQQLREGFDAELAAVTTDAELELVRIKYLGRKSPVAARMKQLGQLSPEQRGAVGKELNVLKTAIEQRLAEAKLRFLDRPSAPAADVTLPGAAAPTGRLHPVTAMLHTLTDLFVGLGFEVAQGPELEHAWYNFDALNIPADHPSRENFDTFFADAPSSNSAKGPLLLRSHTSPVQIRVMEQRQPPLRIIVPGRVFRPDPLDASHSFMFHQVEGLVVDDRASFADLKGTLEQFITRLFGPGTTTRFRPHFFPFTEPSAEVDIACAACKGEGCSTCGRKGWLEILGCGMVHPNVFTAVGYDPARVQGYAFGLGVERITMLKYGITDIRLFFENDLRFLEQFG